MAGQPGLLQRLSEAWHVVARGGIAEAVAHFRRAAGFGSSSPRPTAPYRQVPVVRAAVSKKATCLASMPLMLSTADDRLVEAGPLAELIDRPNPRQSRKDFIQATSAWIDLTGACHWVFPPGTLKGGDDKPTSIPTMIVPVGAWQMKPIMSRADGGGDLIGWKYRPAGHRWEEAITLSLHQVWTVGEDAFDPTDEFGYCSRLETAGLAIAQVYKADLANEASLDNGVEPGGMLVLNGNPSEQQIRDIREQMAERAGVKNRRRHLVVYGNIDWKQIAANFTEMEFSTLQKMKIVDVCVALEVDPAAIGYYEDSNYAHAEAAKAGLWTDTILPRAEWIADEFRRGVVARFTGDASLSLRSALADARLSGRTLDLWQRSLARHARDRARVSVAGGVIDLYPWFDASRVGAVRKAMLERSKEGAIWIEKYLQPPADVIEALDLPLEVHPHQELAWKPMGLVTVDEAAPGSDDPLGTTGGEDPADPEDDGTAGAPSPARREYSEEELAALWQLWRTSWSPIEKQVASKWRRGLFEWRGAILANLERVLGAKSVRGLSAAEQRDLIGEILIDFFSVNGKLLASVRPLMRLATQLGGEQAMEEDAQATGADTPQTFDIADDRLGPLQRQRELRLTGANRTTQKRVAKVLADGIEAQETTAQIAERIRSEFNLASTRANTIARTEVGRTVEESRQIGREQAGVPLKSWLWSRKETGRRDHAFTEQDTMAEPVAQDGVFTIHGTSITCKHPRSTGVPEQDINCGCTTIGRYPGDSVKSVIARYRARGFLGAGDVATERTTS